MTRAVSINKEYPGYSNPGFFRLKNNACLVLTEPGGVQACGPGVYCATLRENTLRPIRKEPQMNTDERRYVYNNFINIFQPEPHTRTHIHPPRPREACTWPDFTGSSMTLRTASRNLGLVWC